jgi:hypothetical protein
MPLGIRVWLDDAAPSALRGGMGEANDPEEEAE